MIVYTIVALIALIGSTFLYLNEKLEKLNENKIINTISLKKLNLFKIIIFLMTIFTILSFWGTMLHITEKMIIISTGILCVNIVFIILFRVKLLYYIKASKKTALHNKRNVKKTKVN